MILSSLTLESCPKLLAILVIFSRPAAVFISRGFGALHGSEEGNVFWVISNPWKAQVYKTELANERKRGRNREAETK
jgi:hypothetical protein